MDVAGLTGNRYRDPMNAATGGSPEHLLALSHYMEHRNVDGGFWGAAVDPLAAEQALTGTVPANRVRAVAVLSDGASRLVDRFGLATRRQLLDLLDRDGPTELIRQVREAERSDLNGSRWTRGKIFDDATAAYGRII